MFAAVVTQVLAAPEGDRITSLPGYNGDFGEQYSGYLAIPGRKFLHYWFVPSRGSKTTDPVLLWLNGGPGCSSMDGRLYEHGPEIFAVPDAELTPNKWAWSNMASVLYIEAPVGVGFSYQSGVPVPHSTDNTTADDNLQALRAFFAAFPEYSTQPLYVSGESYAGKYVPMLSERIVGTSDLGTRFKGFLVGNGVSDENIAPSNAIYAGFFWGKGFLSGPDFALLSSPQCNGSSSSPACSAAWQRLQDHTEDMNIYNVYGTCYASDRLSRIPRWAPPGAPHLGRGRLRDVPPCISAAGATNWLNRVDVQAALHVKMPASGAWSICGGISYDSSVSNMAGSYATVAAAGKRMLVYSGDMDAAVPWISAENFLRTALAWPVVGRDWALWEFNLDAAGSQPQTGGFVTEFARGLTFATVHAAGHMVPQDRPEAAWALFSRWMTGKL